MNKCFALAAATVVGMGVGQMASADVIVTGIVDGTLSGGLPKAIELYITGTEDLSNYTIERSANGGVFGSSSALSGVFTDQFVYLMTSGNEASFDSVFGSSGDFANRVFVGNATGNGDDAFRILDGALNVVDQVWTEDTNDSYRDSYWYRLSGTGPDGGWNPTNWITPGNDALDGLDEAGLAAAIPFGTYNPAGGVVPAPAALAMIGVAGLAGRRRRRTA